MQFKVDQSIANEVWILLFTNVPEKIAESDKILMRHYGEPQINVGGTILDGEETEFTLPDRYLKIRSDFPFQSEFDSKGTPFDTDTQAKVEGYRDEILDRIETALTTLRANVDTFTDTKLYTL